MPSFDSFFGPQVHLNLSFCDELTGDLSALSGLVCLDFLGLLECRRLAGDLKVAEERSTRARPHQGATSALRPRGGLGCWLEDASLSTPTSNTTQSCPLKRPNARALSLSLSLSLCIPAIPGRSRCAAWRSCGICLSRTPSACGATSAASPISPSSSASTSAGACPEAGAPFFSRRAAWAWSAGLRGGCALVVAGAVVAASTPLPFDLFFVRNARARGPCRFLPVAGART